MAFNRAREDFTESERDLVASSQVPLSAAMRRITARRDGRRRREHGSAGMLAGPY